MKKRERKKIIINMFKIQQNDFKNLKQRLLKN